MNVLNFWRCWFLRRVRLKLNSNSNSFDLFNDEFFLLLTWMKTIKSINFWNIENFFIKYRRSLFIDTFLCIMFEIDTFITLKIIFFNFNVRILLDNSTKQSWNKIDVFEFCKNCYMIWIVNVAKRFAFIIFVFFDFFILMNFDFFCSNSNFKISKFFYVFDSFCCFVSFFSFDSQSVWLVLSSRFY